MSICLQCGAAITVDGPHHTCLRWLGHGKPMGPERYRALRALQHTWEDRAGADYNASCECFTAGAALREALDEISRIKEMP